MDIANFTHIILNSLWICKYQIKGGWTISPQHEAKGEALIINTHSIQDLHYETYFMSSRESDGKQVLLIDLVLE
jgi:hypothetical protein